LIDEQDLEAIEEEIVDEEISNNEVDDFVDDIESDEEGMSLEDAGDELEDVMDMEADEEGGEEEVSPEENEERISDLEAAFAELQQEFDALMGGEEEVAPEEEEVPFESVETDEEPVDEAAGKMSPEQAAAKKKQVAQQRQAQVQAPQESVENDDDSDELTEASLEAVPAPKGGNSDGKAMSHNRGAMKPSAANAKNLNQGGTGTDGAAPPVNSGGMDTSEPLENQSK
jgi:hypothetical protein